ncbi:MAG: tRNA (adenosine(37)-N6)-threonylcarbamoyltransferase complex dimerization subunit type 1 TsaB [Pseudomonadota bacterium]
MCVLAIDTCANMCSAAVFSADGAVLGHECEDLGRGHAEKLNDSVALALKAAHRTFADIERIITTVGPGSFTGIRVGVAAARGYGLALNASVEGITTFALLAAEVTAADASADDVMIALAGGRGQLFCQSFRSGEAVSDPHVIDLPSQAKPVFDEATSLIGNGAKLIDPYGTHRHLLVDRATGDLRYAFDAADRATVAPQPLYLRAADAKPQTGFALPRAGTAQS